MTTSVVFFPVPPDRAFAYLADPRNRPDWQSSLRAVADLVPAANGSFTAAGVTWTDVTAVPGVRPAMETISSEEPFRWVEVGRFGRISARLQLTFAAAGEGTDVHVDFSLQALGAGRLLGRVSRRPVLADLRRAARLVAALP